MRTSNNMIFRRTKGFTLIETLIAVTVLMSAVVGPLVLASKGLSASSYARDQVTAYYLAQEALEVVRSIRDDNSLNSDAWDSGITASCSPTAAASPCVIDAFLTGSARLIPCPGSTSDACPTLQQKDDETTGLRYYYQTSKGVGTDSIFKRVLSVTFPDSTVPNNTSEAILSVVVTWQSGTISRTLTLNENMFDWK